MRENNYSQKQRVVVYLYPEIIERMELLMQGDDMRNHTEFITKAVDFYIGYLGSKDSTTYLSEHLLGAINGTLKNTENRMANNLFRLTVEMSLMMNVLAEGMSLDSEWLRQLRIKCINDVRKTKGKILLEDTVAEWQD